MSENQSKWWREKGKKKYRGLCELPVSAAAVRYLIGFTEENQSFMYDEPIVESSDTTVSGDVRLQANTTSLRFERRSGTLLVIKAEVCRVDHIAAGTCPVYVLQRTSNKPDRDAFEAALKWIAETEHLRK